MIIKDDWEKDIEKDRMDRIKSINYSLNNNIEKGVVSDIMYSDSELKRIEKKGSEIKEKLQEEKLNIGYKISKAKIKIDKLLIEIDEVPKKENYNKEELSKNISIVPNTYSYDQIYSKQDEVCDEKSVLKREYNNYVDVFIGCQTELKEIGTIIDNIKDNKQYTLSINLATKLGF